MRVAVIWLWVVLDGGTRALWRSGELLHRPRQWWLDRGWQLLGRQRLHCRRNVLAGRWGVLHRRRRELLEVASAWGMLAEHEQQNPHKNIVG